MSEVKCLAIVGLIACFFGTGFLSIDKVGPGRVSRWVAACNRFVTSRRIFLFLIAVVLSGIVVIFLSHTEGSRLSIFLNCAVREWRVLSVVGFATLALVFYLMAVGQDRLKLPISGGKLVRLLVRLQRFILVLIILFIAGPAIYAIGFGNIAFSVISLGISISMASGFGTVLLANGLVEGVLRAIRFLDRPDATISRFGVLGFGLLALGFALQLAYVFLV